jgi:integrase
MTVVERRDSKGRRRFHARVYVGAGAYRYGPVRDDPKQARIDEGDLLKAPRRTKELTVDKLCDWHLETYPTRPRPRTGRVPHESTVDGIKGAVAAFRRHFGPLKPAEITREDAKDWLARYPWAISPIRTMLHDALDSELIDSDPFKGMAVKRSSGRRNIEVPTVDELYALADGAAAAHREYGPTFRALLLWLAFTCMRPGEVFALRHQDIDGDLIHVRWNVSRVKTIKRPKNEQARTIILPDQARAALADVPRSISSDLVFLSKDGKRYNTGIMGHYWRPVKAAFVSKLTADRRAELDPPKSPLTPYSLRHWGATYMLDVLGLDEFTVSVQMGHTDGGKLVQQVYGHRSREGALERIRRAHNPRPIADLREIREAENG